MPYVGPALPAEHGVAYQFDAVVERVELRQRLRPLGQSVDREESARNQEERGDDPTRDVAEVVDRLEEGRNADPEGSPPVSGGDVDERDREHPPAWIESEEHGHEHREAAVEARSRRDPQRLAR